MHLAAKQTFLLSLLILILAGFSQGLNYGVVNFEEHSASPSTGPEPSQPLDVSVGGPYSAIVGVNFVASASVSGGSAQSFSWDFPSNTANCGAIANEFSSNPTISCSQSGTSSITATAYDSSGNGYTSNQSSIEAAYNQWPNVSLLSPTDGQSYISPASVSLSASASDPNDSITRVAFYYNTTNFIAEDSSAAGGYTATWNVSTPGSYSITARAYDNYGVEVTSLARTITVSSANNPPSVSITSPSNGTAYTTTTQDSATVPIAVNASDPGGAVAKVEFYYNTTTKIGESTSSPFSFTWSNVSPGNYSLTARATDNLGAISSMSGAVNISVVRPPVVANAGGSTTATRNIQKTITGSASGGSGIFSYSWAMQPPNSANCSILGSSTQSNVNISCGSVSSSTIRLTATDNVGASDTDDAAITVTSGISANAGGDQSTIVNESITLNGSTSGGSGPKTYSWTDTTSNCSVSKSSTLNPEVACDELGTYPITLRVTDSSGTTTDTMNLTVVADLAANAGPDRTSTVGSPITLSGSASGGIGNHTYSWTAPSSCSITNGATLTPTITCTSTGNKTITLTATTSTSSDNDSMNLDVTNQASQPSSSPSESSSGSPSSSPEPVQIVISSPTSGQSFPSGSKVTMSATVQNASGAIIMAFYVDGGQPKALDVLPPYSYRTNPLSSGQHTLGFAAFKFSENGNLEQLASSEVVITVAAAAQNPPNGNPSNDPSSSAPPSCEGSYPSVQIIEPKNNEQYKYTTSPPTSIDITAIASDSDRIDRVEFFQQKSGAPRKTRIGSPVRRPNNGTYSPINFKPSSTGTYTISATAYDTKDCQSSTQVQIVVSNDSGIETSDPAQENNLVSVSISSGKQEYNKNSDSQIVLTVQATRFNSSITRAIISIIETRGGENTRNVTTNVPIDFTSNPTSRSFQVPINNLQPAIYTYSAVVNSVEGASGETAFEDNISTIPVLVYDKDNTKATVPDIDPIMAIIVALTVALIVSRGKNPKVAK